MDDFLFTFIETHLCLLLTVLLSVGFIIWLIYRNIAGKKEVTRSLWDYLFLWPLLLTRKEGDKYVQRGFSRREWRWILILVVLGILAVLFTPSGKE